MRLILPLFFSSTAAFAPTLSSLSTATSTAPLFGYLDDLSKDLYQPEDDGKVVSRQESNLKEEDVDRYGVGDWKDFVDFQEFDGGDGQMGVAGDGKEGLDKEWEGQAELAKSKSMSAKVAWGKTTGYADALIDEKGMDTQRAQQLENWMNQQELQKMRNQQRYMTEEFDQTNKDEDWRKLASFGVERNEDFDLDETMGQVSVGDRLDGTIELSGRQNQNQVHEFQIKNSFMGFSDFRARFTPDTSPEWSVEPSEGSLSGRAFTDFTVKYRPSSIGESTGYLIIETEDDKWTYQLKGIGQM